MSVKGFWYRHINDKEVNSMNFIDYADDTTLSSLLSIRSVDEEATINSE